MSKHVMKLSVLLFSGSLLALAACSEQTASTKGEEDAIRAQNQKWLEAIAKHDADAVAVMYAPDGEFMPPNASKVTGRDAIKAAWQSMFQIPGVGLTFTTDKFVFGKSADLAVDIGSYDFKSASGGSSSSDKGKSVVTWVKRDGNWQVLTDMFSSDAPTLPTTPTPPASGATPESAAAPAAPASGAPLAPGTPGTTTTTTTMPGTPTSPPATTTTTTPTPAPATPPAH